MLPAWYQDETLFSWSARFHRLQGGGEVRSIGQMLFGSAHAYKEHDAASHLHALCDCACNSLGDVRTVLMSRTTLVAYIPFLLPAQRKQFEEYTQLPQPVAWMKLFTMPAASLEEKCLRWCPECANEDIAKLGMTAWHRCQQLPGTWICTRHEVMLHSHDTKQAAWHLPPHSTGISPAFLEPASLRVLHSLAQLTKSLAKADAIDIYGLRRVILATLQGQRIISATRPISSEKLAQWFQSTKLAGTIRQLGLAPKLDDGLWLHQTLSGRRAAHPLKWLVLLCAACEGESSQTLIEKLHRPSFFLHWQEDGQGTLWTEDGRENEHLVRHALSKSGSLVEAAQALRISTTTLRRVLAASGTSIGAQYDRLRRAHQINNATNTIKNFLASHPATSRSDIHSYCKGAVASLRRYDPVQLHELLSQVPEANARQKALFGEHRN